MAPQKGFRFQVEALQALQFSSEVFVENVFEMATLASTHARRQTLMVQDIKLVYEVHSMAHGPAINKLKSGMVANLPNKKPTKL